MKSLIGFGSFLLLLTAVTGGCKDDLTVGSDDGGTANDGGKTCASDTDCDSSELCAYAEAARLSISELPETDAKRALLWVPGFVTSRDR